MGRFDELRWAWDNDRSWVGKYLFGYAVEAAAYTVLFGSAIAVVLAIVLLIRALV